MITRKSATTLALIGLSVYAAGCGQKSQTQATSAPATAAVTWHDPATILTYETHGSSGYQLLDEGKLDEAVASFQKQVDLIPTGKWGYYNLACAYGRNKQIEPGFAWLEQAVNNGWDDPDHLQNDGDLEALRTDPRFAQLIERVKSTRQQKDASFAQGLPHYERAPIMFPDKDSLDRWYSAQEALWRRNRSVWFAWQTTAAGVELEGKRVAGLRDLMKGNPEFDYGLERIRAMAQLKTVWSPWGTVTKGVLKEVNDYLAANPGPAGRSEAHYWAGLALYCETHPDSSSDPNWGTATGSARSHFSQVDPGTAYGGAATAWQLTFDLMAAGGSRVTVFPRVREFAMMYHDDTLAMDVAGKFFQEDVVAALWPIPVEGVDIDNKPVTLAEYRGKVVLVDFWATWCGPCRAELPHILAARAKYRAQGFEILSISLDYADRTTPEQYRQWITDKKMNWRHIYDQKDWKGPLVRAFMVNGIPSPFLIGRDGSLAASGEDCRGDKLAESIEAALKGPA